MNKTNISNEVCVLVDRETRHLEYIPLGEIKVAETDTISNLFSKFEILQKNVETFETRMNSKINSLLEVINILTKQIELLTKNQCELAKCYNNLQKAFEKQTAHSSANLTNLMYAIRLLGGKL